MAAPPLGTLTVTQAYCTWRDVMELGVGIEALVPLTPRQRAQCVLWASGYIATALRVRHTLPLVVGLECLGVTGAAATAVLTGAPSQVADVVLRCSTAGAVAGGAVGYQLSTDAGETWSAVATLPASGVVVVDGVTVTIAGTLAVNDTVAWSAGLDSTVRGHAAALAAMRGLRVRGLDPAIENDLKPYLDDVKEWLGLLTEGKRQLDTGADTTPAVSEDGPLFTGQGSADEWVYDPLLAERWEDHR